MKLPKYRAEVPVLHTYWYEISMTPSSSFILDSATLELSREDFCFDVQVNTVRRRFAAPEDQVEEWIYAITLAIASYKQLQRRILPVSNSPRRRRLSLMDEMNWEPGNFLFKDTYIWFFLHSDILSIHGRNCEISPKCTYCMLSQESIWYEGISFTPWKTIKKCHIISKAESHHEKFTSKIFYEATIEADVNLKS